MTSKEALEELLHYATLDDSGFEPAMKRYAQCIKNDLEVLEILRKHITTIPFSNMDKRYVDIVLIPYEEDDEDAEKIREYVNR